MEDVWGIDGLAHRFFGWAHLRELKRLRVVSRSCRDAILLRHIAQRIPQDRLQHQLWFFLQRLDWCSHAAQWLALLVQQRASLIQGRPGDRYTVLHFAAHQGHPLLEALIELAPPYAKAACTKKGTTVLDEAVTMFRLPEAELLWSHGYSLSAGEQLLLHAIREEQPQMARLLLDHGVDAGSKDDCLATALHFACMVDQPAIALSIAEDLLSFKADVLAVDIKDATPLHLAVQHGHSDLIRLLLQARADVNAEDMHDMTPLHTAGRAGNRDVALLLIANGADQQRRSVGGMTVFDVAQRHGFLDFHTEAAPD